MIKIMIANTHSKIDFNDVDKGVKKDFINMLKEKFTVRDKNLERNPMVIRGLMSAEFCFYDIENSILPTGLIPHLRIYSKQNNFELEVKDFRKFPKMNDDMLSKINNVKDAVKIFDAKNIENKDTRADWTIRDWEKKDAKGLHVIKNETPEIYNEMYNKFYNKK